MVDGTIEYMDVKVALLFGDCVDGRASNGELTIQLRKDGFDSIHDVKTKISEAAGGNVTPDLLWLSFGPNARNIGRQFLKDAAVNEETVRSARLTFQPKQTIEDTPPFFSL